MPQCDIEKLLNNNSNSPKNLTQPNNYNRKKLLQPFWNLNQKIYSDTIKATPKLLMSTSLNQMHLLTMIQSKNKISKNNFDISDSDDLELHIYSKQIAINKKKNVALKIILICFILFLLFYITIAVYAILT